MSGAKLCTKVDSHQFRDWGEFSNRFRFSVSHQVRMSGIHQVDTDPNSVQVLSLRPHNKSLRIHQDQLLLAWDP